MNPEKGSKRELYKYHEYLYSDEPKIYQFDIDGGFHILLTNINKEKMKTQIRLTLIILLVSMFSLQVYSHTGWSIFYKYGKVNMWTGSDFGVHEEPVKARIIGQMVSALLEKYNYDREVNITFSHNSIKDSTAYELSYQLNDEKMIPDNLLETGQKEIFLNVLSQKYDTREILQLIEYAISNEKLIEKKQVKKKIDRGFSGYNDETKQFEREYRTFLTVDEDFLESILKQPGSEIIDEIMATRFYRPSINEKEPLFTYFIENDKYHIIYRGTIRKRGPVPPMKYGTQSSDSLLLKLDHIHQLEVTSERRAFVFDTDSSFYMFDMMNSNFNSDRHVIQNRIQKYYPFQIVEMGRMFGIYAQQRKTGKQLWPMRNIIYRVEDDCLFQDMNVILDSISGNDTKYYNISWN